MAVADNSQAASRSFDLDDKYKDIPMWVLTPPTLDRLGNFLNNRKILRTEPESQNDPGELRDYRGLEDHAKLIPEEKGRVQASNNKAGMNYDSHM